MKATIKKLIAVALIVCVATILVAVAILRHANNKPHGAWWRDHATPTTPPKPASASEHAENSSKSVFSSYIAASNTQHDQRYKSDVRFQKKPVFRVGSLGQQLGCGGCV